jgi:hypothetical protein
MTRRRLHTTLSGVGLVLWTLNPAIGAPARAAADNRPLQIGSERVLLVDHWAIARMDGARLRLHSPCRREAVFTFDAPWEGAQSGYVTLVQDEDHYRLYYRGGGDLVREYTCVAFSDDAIHWTRPKLGLFEFEGSKDNNIIWTGEKKAYWESHNFSPFIDTNPAARPEARYKAVTLSRAIPPGETDDRKVLFAFTSPDGIHWKRLQDTPIITQGSFDSHNVAFWDPVLQRYVCYLRHGREGKRSISRATSVDFVHWTDSVPLEFDGTPIEHFYTNGIVFYDRSRLTYLGFPMRFIPPSERNIVGFDKRKTDGLSDAVFMSSQDGLNWHRPFMEAFIRPGLDPKNWGGAHGNNTPAWGLLQTGPGELSIYWSEHYSNYPETDLIPHLRRGTVRLDGFASVNADYEGGEMITKPLVFKGRELSINYSTSAVGSITVEVQDLRGKPAEGYTLADCEPIWGDEIERTVRWNSGTDLGRLAGKPVRLRFVLKDADLYAFRFTP